MAGTARTAAIDLRMGASCAEDERRGLGVTAQAEKYRGAAMRFPGGHSTRRDGRLIRANLRPFRSVNPAFRTGVNFALGKPDVPG